MNKEQYIIKLNQSILANDIDNVKLYFDKIENKNIQDVLFFNAIKYAILKDFNEITSFIFNEINKHSEETIYKIKELSELSSSVGNLKLVKLFCNNYKLTNEPEIFFEAVSYCHIDIMEYLINKENAFILYDNFSTLRKAAETGNLQVFKMVFNTEGVQYYLKALKLKDKTNKDIKVTMKLLTMIEESILTCAIYDMSDILEYILNEIEEFKDYISDWRPLDSVFVKCANFNSIDCFKVCLSKDYLDPCHAKNSSIKTAFKKGFIEMSGMLIQQPSVRELLRKEDDKLYKEINNLFITRNF